MISTGLSGTLFFFFRCHTSFFMDSFRGYDLLAPFYDALSSIVFGNSMYRAQVHLLSDIPPGSKVLVLGGGTGRWLREVSIQRFHPEITYIDSSHGMLKRARTNG